MLATLPAADFPVIDELAQQQVLKVPQADLRRLLDKTHFSMAQQDVRYYLNGMLLETDGKMLRTVATDGHRLALCEMDLPSKATGQQVIVPRKGVLELQRLLGTEGDVQITIGSNHIRAQIGDVRFTSKLIDGRFPEYSRVIPAASPKAVVADREVLRAALQRTAILANEKYRGIRLALKKNSLTLQAHNPEQEEAEEQVEVSYKGDELEVGFNVSYLLDALAAVDGNEVEIGVTDGNSSCLVRAPGRDERPVRRDADAPVGRVAWPSALSAPSGFAACRRSSSSSIRRRTCSSARTRRARPACWKRLFS